MAFARYYNSLISEQFKLVLQQTTYNKEKLETFYIFIKKLSYIP